jgi:hypothetical protein
MRVREGGMLTFEERIVDMFKNTCSLSYNFFPIKGGIVVI